LVKIGTTGSGEKDFQKISLYFYSLAITPLPPPLEMDTPFYFNKFESPPLEMIYAKSGYNYSNDSGEDF
jgi:hypothetical protein